MNSAKIHSLRVSKTRLRQWHRGIERFADWCALRCPLFSMLLVLAAHTFPAPFWWQAVCDSLVTLLILALVGSFGMGLAMGALADRRPPHGLKWVSVGAQICFGFALAAIGIAGAWKFFSRAVLGL